MAVAHIQTVGFDQSTVASLHTISSFTVSAGANRALIAMVGIEVEGRTVSGITWNGSENFTVKSTHTGTTGTPDSRVEIWHLVAPTETTADIVIALAGGTATFSGGVTYATGVHQVTPLGLAATSDGSTANPAVNVTDSAVGDLVIDLLHDSFGDGVAGAGQTGRYDNTAQTSYFSHGSTEPGAASVTMSWTQSGSPRHLVAINVRQVAAAQSSPMFRGS